VRGYNEEDRPLCAVHQTADELGDGRRAGSSSRHHESHRPLAADSGQQMPTGHGWQTIRGNIQKDDFSPRTAGLGLDSFVVGADPSFHHGAFRCCEWAPRFPARAPQPAQQPHHRGAAQVNLETFPDQRRHHGPRPQAGGEIEIQRTCVAKRFGDPLQLRRGQPTRTARDVFGVERLPTTLTKLLQPCVDRAATETQTMDDRAGILAGQHLLNRPSPNGIQPFSAQFLAAVYAHERSDFSLVLPLSAYL